MEVVSTNIPDVKLITLNKYGDERGYFMETFRDNWFREHVSDVSFVQDNQSKSVQGVLRGLHYQIKQPQGKLVRVTSGEVFDVAVDLRRSSPTYGQWVGEILSAENGKLLWIPPWFAHGFYVLSDSAEFAYKCTDYYAPDYERSILWDDADIEIKWPLISGQTPSLSAKDLAGQTFARCDSFD